MSYQPQPPMGAAPQPGMQPYGAAPNPYAAPPVAAPAAKKGKGLVLAGIGLAVVGLGTGVALIAMSGSAREETVKKFARAPAGCTTTLQFDKRATFTLYLETKGSVDDVEGDCAANGASYDRGDDDPPRVSLSLFDSADQVVELTAADSPSYSTGGYRGRATQRVRIAEPGTYRLTVTSDATDFAIAVGGDPDVDAASMKTAGIAAAIGGLLLGGLLILLGTRKRRPPVAAANAVPAWQQAPAPVPGYQPQGTVPGYQPQPQYTPPPSYAPAAPSAPPQWSQPGAPQPPTVQPPAAPPSPPAGSGWGAPER